MEADFGDRSIRRGGVGDARGEARRRGWVIGFGNGITAEAVSSRGGVLRSTSEEDGDVVGVCECRRCTPNESTETQRNRELDVVGTSSRGSEGGAGSLTGEATRKGRGGGGGEYTRSNDTDFGLGRSFRSSASSMTALSEIIDACFVIGGLTTLISASSGT